MKQNNSNKKIYLEMLRIIACALVLFNHTAGYLLYTKTGGETQVFYMSLTMLTRINVPLFYMISGAVLFSKDEEWKEVFKKRILKIICLLLLFDLILFIANSIYGYMSGEQFKYVFGDFIRGFLSNEINGSSSYYYLYSYLGILLVLPFMQRIAKGFSKTEFIVLLVLHFIISSALPMYNMFCKEREVQTLFLCESFQVPFAFTKPFFYPLIGYYLENNIDVKSYKLKHILGFLLLALSGIALSNFFTIRDALFYNLLSQNFVQLFDYVTAIVAFLIIKYLFVVVFPKINEMWISKVICFWGSATIGVYLLDPVLKLLFFEHYDLWITNIMYKISMFWENIFFLPLIPSIGWIIISTACGILITTLLRFIPIIKKIL